MIISFEQFLEESTQRVVRTDDSGQRQVLRVKDRKTRERRATQTTGRSRADRKRSARMAARTRRRDSSGTRKAIRKRKVTMRKRASLGVK